MSQDLPFSPRVGGTALFLLFSFKACLFDLQCNGSADKEREFRAAFENVTQKLRYGFPCQDLFTCLKSPAQLAARQSIFTKSRTQGKAATVVSYRISRILAKHKKPFKDGDVVKEAFPEAVDSLFEDFKNKTQIIKPLKKCNSPAIPIQGDVREWLWMWRSN